MIRRAASVLLVLLAACGDHTMVDTITVPPPGGGTADAALPPATDADASTPDAPDAAAPTLASVMPQIRTGSGPTLATPKAIVISFPGDPNAAAYESATSTIASSAYWKETTSEYGVGPLAALAPVHLQASAPAAVSDAQIQAILQRAINNPANAFPTPDTSTIYTILIPNGTAATGAQGGTACGPGGFAGYHRSFTLTNGTTIAYAVIVECQANIAMTRTLAHELAEAATDPFATSSQPAYVGVGPRDLGYVVGSTLGSEVGDMCETTPVYLLPTENMKLARIWSNGAASAGHNPCLPVPPGEAWFFALPSASPPDQVTGTRPKGSMPAIGGAGFAVANGASRIVSLGLLSDPGTAPWTIAVHAVTEAGLVTFALDRSTGQAGDVLQLTITAVGDVSGGVPFAIDSTLGATTHTWLGVVGSPP